MNWKLKYVEIDILQLFLSGHTLLRREVGQRLFDLKVSGAALVGHRTLLHYETGISPILRQRPPSGARRACRHCNNSVALALAAEFTEQHRHILICFRGRKSFNHV